MALPPPLTCAPGQGLRAKDPDKRAALLLGTRQTQLQPLAPGRCLEAASRGCAGLPPDVSPIRSSSTRCAPTACQLTSAASVAHFLVNTHPCGQSVSVAEELPGDRRPRPSAAHALPWLIGAPQPVRPRPRLAHQLRPRHGDGALRVDAARAWEEPKRMHWALVQLGARWPPRCSTTTCLWTGSGASPAGRAREGPEGQGSPLRGAPCLPPPSPRSRLHSRPPSPAHVACGLR